MQKELLIPVGNYESLKYAVFNGCDAVYLAGQKYGARAYAQNFTDEEITKAISFCHLYNVKVYVAINTMIFAREFKSVINFITFLVKNKVDALIIADIGLISEVHKLFPSVEIHASTQAHTFNSNQIAFLKTIGVKRVILDRELPNKEVQKLSEEIDVEVFIHGALCVCYSGNCLMSYMNQKRSGNRGCCAQNCRLPYQLLYQGKPVNLKDKYLLSTKELNTSSNLSTLLNSKVKSFKVEGRLKSPTYVAFITRFYREIIDNYSKINQIKITNEKLNELKTIFNRDFTKGYLFNEDNIYNMQTSNHQGIYLGEVLSTTKKKIKIKLKRPLHQEDGIRFSKINQGMIVNYLYDQNNRLIKEAPKDSIVYVDNKVNLKEPSEVRKTIDHQLELQYQKIKPIKIPLTMKVTIDLQSFKISVSDGKNTLNHEAKIVSKANKIPITKEDIQNQLLKTGNTPFIIQKITITMPNNIFIPLSKINSIRRELLNKLEEVRKC